MAKIIITTEQLATIVREPSQNGEDLKTKLHEMSVICQNLWQVIESEQYQMTENLADKISVCHSEIVNIARIVNSGDIKNNKNPNINFDDLIIGTK